ncbi:hypothetical protein RUND412_007184 [Rhizina undulata]
MLPSLITSGLAGVILFAAGIVAHSTVQEVFVNDVSNGLYNCVRKAADKHHEPDGGQAGDTEDPVASSYIGPYQVYMAEVDDAATSDSVAAEWFKIYEDGYHVADNTWGLDDFRALGGKVGFTVPCDLADGDYLVRGEFLSFHNGPAQNQIYMGCIQLRVSGGLGTADPSPVVLFPGAYQSTDPGIDTSVYYPLPTAYLPPGPRPYTPVCDGVTAVLTTATGSSPTSATTQTSVPSLITSAPSASSTAAAQTKYGQCGGQGYTGPSVCADGTCSAVSPTYYSQCL